MKKILFRLQLCTMTRIIVLNDCVFCFISIHEKRNESVVDYFIIDCISMYPLLIEIHATSKYWKEIAMLIYWDFHYFTIKFKFYQTFSPPWINRSEILFIRNSNLFCKISSCSLVNIFYFTWLILYIMNKILKLKMNEIDSKVFRQCLLMIKIKSTCRSSESCWPWTQAIVPRIILFWSNSNLRERIRCWRNIHVQLVKC
jgi:hypothetical protein